VINLDEPIETSFYGSEIIQIFIDKIIRCFMLALIKLQKRFARELCSLRNVIFMLLINQS